MERGDRGARRGGAKKSPASPWEWAIGVASAVLVLGMVAFMLYDGIAGPDTPPQLEVRVDSVHAVGARGYLVELRIHNSGSATAAGVQVEGELRSDTGTVERAQVTVSYVPGRSHRTAGLIFAHDPRRHQLRVQPRGYATP